MTIKKAVEDGYDQKQIWQIAKGYKEGLTQEQVEVYQDVRLKHLMMLECRKSLKQGITVQQLRVILELIDNNGQEWSNEFVLFEMKNRILKGDYAEHELSYVSKGESSPKEYYHYCICGAQLNSKKDMDNHLANGNSKPSRLDPNYKGDK